MNYGKVVGLNVGNVEEAHLFHFYPKAKTLFLGIPGCNFMSDFCSSFELSRGLHHKSIDEIKSKTVAPDDLVNYAEKKKCSVIVYTYTEPFMGLEFAFKACKLAHRLNIKNVFVTNGFVNTEAIKKISKHLDAIVVNIKASADIEFYKRFMNVDDVSPIFRALKQMMKYRIFVEITNQIIPQLGDDIEQSRKLSQWISSELSPEIPLHILPFYPEYAMTELPATPSSELRKCAEIAIRTGLRYVYIDNSTIIGAENTYCYNCRELLIERIAGKVKKINLVGDRCPNCGVKINLIR